MLCVRFSSLPKKLDALLNTRDPTDACQQVWPVAFPFFAPRPALSALVHLYLWRCCGEFHCMTIYSVHVSRAQALWRRSFIFFTRFRYKFCLPARNSHAAAPASSCEENTVELRRPFMMYGRLRAAEFRAPTNDAHIPAMICQDPVCATFGECAPFFDSHLLLQ